MSTLLFSDIHLTDNEIDSYRNDIFNKICKIIESREYDKDPIKDIIFLGDLTEKKDNHSAKLVNLIVDGFRYMSEYEVHITILKGNHDYIDENVPFFKFLESMTSKAFISYINEPASSVYLKQLFLPHTRNYVEDWKNWTQEEGYDYIFAHQTFTGSKSSNNFILDGIPTDLLIVQELKKYILVTFMYHKTLLIK